MLCPAEIMATLSAWKVFCSMVCSMVMQLPGDDRITCGVFTGDWNKLFNFRGAHCPRPQTPAAARCDPRIQSDPPDGCAGADFPGRDDSAGVRQSRCLPERQRF